MAWSVDRTLLLYADDDGGGGLLLRRHVLVFISVTFGILGNSLTGFIMDMVRVIYVFVIREHINVFNVGQVLVLGFIAIPARRRGEIGKP